MSRPFWRFGPVFFLAAVGCGGDVSQPPLPHDSDTTVPDANTSRTDGAAVDDADNSADLSNRAECVTEAGAYTCSQVEWWCGTDAGSWPCTSNQCATGSLCYIYGNVPVHDGICQAE
jgi:hypothetical protein